MNIPVAPRIATILEAAWQLIRDADIRWLPVDPFILAERQGWRMVPARRIIKNEHFDPRSIDEERGAVILVHRDKGTPTIAYNDLLRPKELLRWTVLREMGHILLGHVAAWTEGVRRHDRRSPVMIQEAEAFAAEVLAPLPVLRAAGAIRREAIAYLCDVPETVAEEREKALAEYDQYPMYRRAEGWMRKQFEEYLRPVAHCAGPDWPYGMLDLIKRNPEGKPMNKKHAYIETDERGRFLFCPRCGNRNFSDDAKYCKMCGIYLFNECTNQSQFDGSRLASEGWCGRINPGDARYCEHCGAETVLTHLGLLKPWEEVMIPKKEAAPARVPDPLEENDGKPIEISKDEIPF